MTDSKARIMRPPNHSSGRGRDKARATAGIQPGCGQVRGGETKSEFEMDETRSRQELRMSLVLGRGRGKGQRHGC